MAKRIVHHLVDDIDGTEIAEGEGETLNFSISGTAYEIDLTTEHAAELRAAFEPYISAGRRVSSSTSSATSTRTRSPQVRNSDIAEIRSWAKENGHTVSDRGRVPQPIVDAYRAAH